MKKKNEKLVHTLKLKRFFYWLHDLSLSEAIEELKRVEKAALEEVRSYGYSESEFIGFKIEHIGNGTYWINAMFQESDESYKKRLKKQKQLELQMEHEEYERLKLDSFSGFW